MQKIPKKLKIIIIISFLLIGSFAITFNSSISDLLKTSLFYGTDEIESQSGNTQLPSRTDSQYTFISICDVSVVGGGASGFAAAIQSARMGVKTCIFEEGTVLGGMITAAGVSAFDGGSQDLFRGGIFGELRTAIERYYHYDFQSTQECSVSYLCFEPRVALRIINEMVKETENLQVFYNIDVQHVYRSGQKVTGLKIKNSLGSEYVIPSKVVIDATEFGDIIELANIPYDLGPDENSREPHVEYIEECIQPITYVLTITRFENNVTIPEPPNYNKENYICSVKNTECPDAQYTFKDLLSYGKLPNGKYMINWPHNRYGNDFHATAEKYELQDRDSILQSAKYYSLGFLYFLQTELGQKQFGLTNEYKTSDKLPSLPYVRESRRIKGVDRIDEVDILPTTNGFAPIQNDSIAIVDHPLDLHFCESYEDLYAALPPFQLPYGVLIPKSIDGFLAAEKNISVSHIVNGATRVQPVAVNVGQAAGTAAAIAVQEDIEIRNVDVKKIQKQLLEDKVPLFFYKDIHADHSQFKDIMNVSVKGIFNGYKDKNFYPDNNITRRDFIKVAYRSLNPDEKYDESQYINKAYTEGVISGYMVDGKTYLDLDAPVSRAQAIKMLLAIYNYTELNFKLSPFEDLDAWATGWIERAYSLGVVKGVNNTKFDPNRNLTRAEAATIISRIMDIRGL